MLLVKNKSAIIQPRRIVNYFKKDNILLYTFFNYIDKGLAFVAPLSILYLFDDKKTYNEVEYIFSIASLLFVFLELGIKPYYFYAYKNSENKTKLISEIKGSINLLVWIYTVVLIVSFGLHFSELVHMKALYFFIAIRAVYLFLSSFLNYHYRLLDNPSWIYPITISINIGSIGILLIEKIVNLSYNLLFLFFLFPFTFIILYAIKNIKDFNLKILKSFFSILKKAIYYSWPIILNILLISFMNNYGKIYAYEYLNEDAMFQISFALRLSLIIHLAHASALGYLSKNIYINYTPKMFWKNFLLYSKMIGVVVCLALFGIFVTKFFGVLDQFQITLATLLIFIYVIIWCYQSYFEIYYNRIGKTKHVLSFSIISACLFFISIYIFKVDSILKISSVMVVSAFVNFMLIMSFGVRRKIFIGYKD